MEVSSTSYIGRLIKAMRTCAFRHWTPKYLYNRFKLFLYEIKHRDHPWLTQQANTILSSCLAKTDVGLEWGSGRSTIWFAKRVAHLTSVEHDPRWYERVKKKLAECNITNTKLYHYKATSKREDIENSPYAEVADNFPDNSLDFALVDGVFRSECALRALRKIKPGGLLIIDNINWYLPSTSSAPNSRTEQNGSASQRWGHLAELLKEWRCIWTSNGVTDTAIWVKPCSQSNRLADYDFNEMKSASESTIKDGERTAKLLFSPSKRLIKNKDWKRLLYIFIVFYVVIVLLFSHLKWLSPQEASALSLLFIFLIPLRVGEIIYPSLSSIAQTIDNLETWIRVGVVWSIGMLTLFLAATMMSFLFGEALVLFSWLTLAVSLIPFRWMRITHVQNMKFSFKVSAKTAALWLSIISAGILYLIPRFKFLPFPMLGGATYAEIFSVIRFQDMGIAGIGYGHPTVVEPLLGSISSLLSIHPIFLLNALSYVAPFVYGYIILSIVQKIIPSTIGMVAAPFLALFVIDSEYLRCISQHGVLYIFIPFILFFALKQVDNEDFSLSSFLYGIILALIGGCIIAALFFSDKSILNGLLILEFVTIALIVRAKPSFGSISGSSLFWGFWCGIWPILLHEFEGILLTGLVLLTTIFASRKNKRLLLVISITVVCIWFFMQCFRVLNFPNNSILSSFFPFDMPSVFERNFFSKLSILQSSAPEVFLLAFLLSIPVGLYSNNDKIHFFLFASLISLGFYFFPESLFFRFDILWAITGVVVVASSLSLAVGYVKKSNFSFRIKSFSSRLTFNPKIIKAATLLLIGLLVATLIGSMISYRYDLIVNSLNEEGVYSYDRTYEMNAALWLRARFSSIYKPVNLFDTSGANKFLVLSDPYTMLLMRSWTGCSQLTNESHYIYSSAYTQPTKDQWDELKRELFLANDATRAFTYLTDKSKGYLEVYIIVSHRTILWMQQDSECFILDKYWSLKDKVSDHFYMGLFLKVVYKIDNSIIVYSFQPK